MKTFDDLYSETFAIESEDDLKRLKTDATVSLSNNEVVFFSNKFKGSYFFDVDDLNSVSIPFIALKGATVTQEK